MSAALRLLAIALLFSLGPAPQKIIGFQFSVDRAEARPFGRGGGAKIHRKSRPQGAKTRARPAAQRPNRMARKDWAGVRPNRPAARPATRPAARPNRPAARPVTRPAPGRPAAVRPNRPELARPNRPNRPVTRPGAQRPPHARPPGHRPPNTRPPGYRPPGYRPRPPLAGRPPGWRPPGYRPPHWRPPAWRPPVYRPPYYRPPHWRWGSYYYYPRWGWYFTAAVAGATLVYVATLPEDDDCTPVNTADETMYVCNGVLYRATVYESETVYEIVSEAEENVTPPPPADTAQPVPGGDWPRLASPYMRGTQVRDIQAALSALGYDTGGIDGVFGRGTDAAVRDFQAAEGLPITGAVDPETLAALGLG